MSNHVSIGVGAIVRRGNEILFQRRSKSIIGGGTWATPGGGLEFGETPESCAIRETMEETGVTVDSPRFLALTNDVFIEDNRHYVTIWMECNYVEGEARVVDEYEADKVGWYNISELPNPLFLPMNKFFKGESYPSLGQFKY